MLVCIIGPQCPHNSQKRNGAAERGNRTLVEAVRSMLQSKGLPLKLWAEAISTVTYVINRTGPVKDSNKTSFELWKGKATDVDHLKIFVQFVMYIYQT